MTGIVVDPQTLRALGLALRSTVAEAERADRAALAVAQRVESQLRVVVAARSRSVALCETALVACRESDRGDCSREAAALAIAQELLDAAKRALAMAVQGIMDYRSRSRAIRGRLEQIGGRGQRFLSKKLDKVAAVNAGTGASTARGAISAPHAGSVASGVVRSLSGLPAGCAMVPIDLIDQTENPIRGAQDFAKGYTIEDLDYAFDLLESTILPDLAAGADPSAFAVQDRANGVWGVRSLADTYGGFLKHSSGDVIKLELRPDGSYGIVNGRHRIYVAQLGGRTHVPAFFVGDAP